MPNIKQAAIDTSPPNEKLGFSIPEHFYGIPMKTHSLIWVQSVYLIAQTSDPGDAEPSQMQEPIFCCSQNTISFSASWVA